MRGRGGAWLPAPGGGRAPHDAGPGGLGGVAGAGARGGRGWRGAVGGQGAAGRPPGGGPGGGEGGCGNGGLRAAARRPGPVPAPAHGEFLAVDCSFLPHSHRGTHGGMEEAESGAPPPSAVLREYYSLGRKKRKPRRRTLPLLRDAPAPVLYRCCWAPPDWGNRNRDRGVFARGRLISFRPEDV